MWSGAGTGHGRDVLLRAHPLLHGGVVRGVFGPRLTYGGSEWRRWVQPVRTPLRLALTPGATKHRRVRRRAVTVFRAAAEKRTAGRTGILIYLSMGERRAEIVADEAILQVTDDHTWGEAMTALLVDVREGRVGDGMVAAIEQVGAVLAERFPRSATDTNEIPDKLIEL